MKEMGKVLLEWYSIFIYFYGVKLLFLAPGHAALTVMLLHPVQLPHTKMGKQSASG